MAKTIVEDREVKFLDPETGELKEVTSQRIYRTKISTERFYMTFIDYVAPLYALKSNSLKNLLIHMCEEAEFNTGKVALTTAARKVTCAKLGISNNTLTNYLKKLKDLKLISGKDGEFIINPQIFWKGDTVSRASLLQEDEIKITFELK